MTLHEVITCDVCNEDEVFNPEDIEEQSQSSAFLGNEEQATAAGWEINPGDPFREHVCPLCLEPQPGDEGFEEGGVT